MLTSLYYYNHYRPYLIKPGDRNAGANSNKGNAPLSKEKITIKSENAPHEVALNKSLNKEIVSFAKGIYKNTTDLKYTAKKMASDMNNYAKYSAYEEFDQEAFENNFSRDLDVFTKSYNHSMSFLRTQEHSKYLGAAAQRLEDLTDGSKNIIAAMGVKKTEDGALELDLDSSTLWSGKNTERKTEAANKFFSEIYDVSSNILNNPMSKHMNFKNLNYYYNYQVDKVQVDSFQIVKTGLLVNLAL